MTLPPLTLSLNPGTCVIRNAKGFAIIRDFCIKGNISDLHSFARRLVLVWNATRDMTDAELESLANLHSPHTLL